MAVTLTTDAKDWIARYLGIGNCMTETEQSFTYRDSVNNIDIPDRGGTATIVNRLVDSVVPYVKIGTAEYTYATLKRKNNNVDLVYPDDVVWVMGHDKGTAQYCYGVKCTPGARRCRDSSTVEECRTDRSGWDVVQTCGTGYRCSGGTCVAVTPGEAIGETKPFEVYVGGGAGCDPGAPDVTLDTSEAFAYFKADPITYVGVMDILVHNLSTECYAYFTWEMRMWDGYGYTTCPTIAPERQEISRFLATVSDKKVITVSRLNASENKMISGSFEIPSWYVGAKTICLSLWGDFDKSQLLSDLADQGYAEEVTW